MTNRRRLSPRILTEYEPGAIVIEKWGYENSHTDFYCITERRGNSITVLPMSKHIEQGVIINHCCAPELVATYSVPLTIDYDSEKLLAELVKDVSGTVLGFNLRDGIQGNWVRLWDGRSVLETAMN